jgi:hypothetical protein
MRDKWIIRVDIILTQSVGFRRGLFIWTLLFFSSVILVVKELFVVREVEVISHTALSRSEDFG